MVVNSLDWGAEINKDGFKDVFRPVFHSPKRLDHSDRATPSVRRQEVSGNKIIVQVGRPITLALDRPERETVDCS
jgi:hypothetical protein